MYGRVGARVIAAALTDARGAESSGPAAERGRDRVPCRPLWMGHAYRLVGRRGQLPVDEARGFPQDLRTAALLILAAIPLLRKVARCAVRAGLLQTGCGGV